MKKLFIIIYILYTGLIYSQNRDFEILIDSDYDETVTDFIRTPDNNYLGLVHKAPITDSVYVYKSYLYSVNNKTGDTISICLGKKDTICFYKRIYNLPFSNDGYLLIGNGRHVNGNPYKPFVLVKKIGLDLSNTWEKVFHLDIDHYVESVCAIQKKDSNILFACSPADIYKMFITEITGSGDSITSKMFTDEDSGIARFFTFNPDSTKIWLHTKWAHYQSSGSPCSIISLDSELNQESVYYYPEWYDRPYFSLCYPGNQLLSVGNADQFYPNKVEKDDFIGGYLLDSVCNTNKKVWLTNKDTLSRPAEVKGIDYFYPDCIYILGNHNYYIDIIGHAPNWIYIARLNDSLELKHEQYIGGDNTYNYWPYTVTAADDGGVFIAATRQPINAPYHEKDVFFLKIDSTGYITDNHNISKIPVKEAILYPNPGIDNLNIRTAHTNSTLYVYDNLGNLLFSYKLKKIIDKIDVSKLKSGVYHYIIIKDKKEICNGTWIKSKES